MDSNEDHLCTCKKERDFYEKLAGKAAQKWPYRKYKGCILDFDGDL